MPKLNNRGEPVSGTADGTVVVNSSIIATNAGLACWLDDDNVIYVVAIGAGYIESANVRTGVKTRVDGRSADKLIAGGGNWAAFKTGLGVFSNVLPNDPNSTVGAAGRDGTLAIIPNPTLGFILHAPSGAVTPGGVGGIFPTDLQVLGPIAAQWNHGGKIIAFNYTQPQQTLLAVTGAIMVTIIGVSWVVYRNAGGGTPFIAHPSDDSMAPFTIGAADAGHQYNFDAVGVGTRIYYTYSKTTAEAPGDIVSGWIDTASGVPGLGLPGGGSDTILTSSATFNVAGASLFTKQIEVSVLPSAPLATGKGRISHPTLGAFDYQVKPDEWVNIDADIITTPTWASVKTLTSVANTLWLGSIRDVVIEERWKALGGLAMPIGMLRMLMYIFSTPVDPAVGFVEWFPNYISPLGFKVLVMNLTAGGSSGLAFDDVVNYLDADGNPDGWVTNQVVLTLKIVDRL